jgi:hypothetical protein
MRCVLFCLLAALPALARAQTDQLPAQPPPRPAVQALTAQERATRAQQFQALDARLATLVEERRRRRLGWPIALMATGFMLFPVGGLAALEAGARSSYDEHVAARVFGYFAVPGAALILGGAAFLGVRVRQRRRRAFEIRELEQRRRLLQLQLIYGLSSAPGGFGRVLLAGRF